VWGRTLVWRFWLAPQASFIPTARRLPHGAGGSANRQTGGLPHIRAAANRLPAPFLAQRMEYAAPRRFGPKCCQQVLGPSGFEH
jgi:hypothetical protein